MIRSTLLLPLLVAATSAASQQLAPQRPLAEKCPKLSASERAEIERPEKLKFPELAWYARENCVSIAEAKRRMEIQSRDAIGPETEPGGPPPPPKDSIGSVSQAIQKNEAETFAGLWIQHQPTYGVVVAFTRNAKATLAKYTKDPLFIPLDRPGPTQAELYASQERLLKDLERFGARPSYAGTDIMKAQVEIAVVGDLSAFRAAVDRGEVALPRWVRIQGPAPLPHPAPPLPANWRATVKAFPQARYRSGGMELAILKTGTVILEGGCLRLKGERRSPVIVWPAEAALDMSGGKVRVLNRGNGETIDLDSRINLGGNARELDDAKDVVGTDAACPGPYYALGNFGRMDRFDQSDLDNRVREVQRERKLSEAAARQWVEAELERTRQLLALAPEIAAKAPDRFGGLGATNGGAHVFWVGDKADALALFPVALRPFVSVQQVPRPIGLLKAERNRLLDQFEAAGIKASASEEVIGGRIMVHTDDLPALSRAALAGRVRFPEFTTIATNGAGPDGYRPEAYQAANRVLEAAPDFAEIRRLVEATPMPSEQRRDGSWTERLPSRAQSLETTRFLIALGFRATDIRGLRAAGSDPIRAWAMINGMVGPDIRAIVARDVAIGELVELTAERLGDGRRTTALFRLIEPLKGDRKESQLVRVRLQSGPDAEGRLQQANDEPLVVPGLPGSLEHGSRWLLFLTSDFADHQARMSGGRARPGDMIAFRELIELKDGRLDQRFAPEWWPRDLSGLRAALTPVDRAFDAANAKAGGGLMSRR